jgi:hypothetical protein
MHHFFRVIIIKEMLINIDITSFFFIYSSYLTHTLDRVVHFWCIFLATISPLKKGNYAAFTFKSLAVTWNVHSVIT